MSFRCTTCGEEHDELPDIGADKPDQLLGVPEDEYDDSIRLTGDTCVSGDDYFIRAGRNADGRSYSGTRSRPVAAPKSQPSMDGTSTPCCVRMLTMCARCSVAWLIAWTISMAAATR